jgi:EAL domain-containing protein (putative c-di-GMP-specific phosphodiesterase class I)
VAAKDFIPIAESCGLVDKIDLLVTDKVLQQQKEWNRKKMQLGFISINISAVSFKKTEFLASLCGLISDSDVDSGLIEIEISERLLTQDKQSRNILNRLKRLGVRLSLDDYGVGATSIKSLKDYQLNTLKIDRSYIHDQVESETVAIVLKNIITLANDLGLDVVAQGVETPEQKLKLEATGCHIGQGHMLTRPMDAHGLETLLKPEMKDNVIQFKRVT